MAWLDAHPYASFKYCDEEGSEDIEVYLETGSINDREWILVGRGRSASAAIDAAIKRDAARLSDTPHDAPRQDAQRTDWLVTLKDLHRAMDRAARYHDDHPDSHDAMCAAELAADAFWEKVKAVASGDAPCTPR